MAGGEAAASAAEESAAGAAMAAGGALGAARATLCVVGVLPLLEFRPEVPGDRKLVTEALAAASLTALALSFSARSWASERVAAAEACSSAPRGMALKTKRKNAHRLQPPCTCLLLRIL